MDDLETVLIEEPGVSDGPAAQARSAWSGGPLPLSLVELDETIRVLVDEIGLILAQLAEGAEAWCARTSRSSTDYAIWRRRALLAKVYKEQRLRECKRRRHDLAAAGTSGDRFHTNGTNELLLVRCRAVLNAWDEEIVSPRASALGRALKALAECLDEHQSFAAHAQVVGRMGTT
jgi:hypothetical protein